MPKPLTFTQPANYEGLANSPRAAALEKELEAASRDFKYGDPFPETPRSTANAILTQRAQELSFSTGKPYMECVKEVLRRHPHLKFGVGPYMADKHFTAIRFRAEADDHADA